MTRADYVGESLEARAQRVFLAQGIFAERYLRVTTGDRRTRKTATDVDVLLSEYSSTFHLTRSHIECKGGKSFHILDRTFWMHGVKDLLGATASYFVLDEFDPEVMRFARDLGIEFLTVQTVTKMEESYGVPQNVWPYRSDYEVLSPILTSWRKAAKRSEDRTWSELGTVREFIEEESWPNFRYGLLNKLFRQLENLSTLASARHLDTEALRYFGNYCTGALVVRLSQYLMFVCRDVLTMGGVTRDDYLRTRLTCGDQDPHAARTLVDASVGMVRVALKEHNIEPPSRLDADVILSAPAYADNFLQLIQRLVHSPSEARYATIATEAFHFGNQVETTGKFPRLASAVKAGSTFAALIRGFLLQSFNFPAELLTPFDAQKALGTMTTTGETTQRPLPS